MTTRQSSESRRRMPTTPLPPSARTMRTTSQPAGATATRDTANSKKIYEVCGHLKFGTGSAAGSLVLPHLTKLGAATADVVLTFRACPYTEPKAVNGVYTIYGNQDRKDFTVSIAGGGYVRGRNDENHPHQRRFGARQQRTLRLDRPHGNRQERHRRKPDHDRHDREAHVAGRNKSSKEISNRP